MRSLTCLLFASAVLAPRPADACLPPRCTYGAFVPATGTTIPQNAPGLYWRPLLDQSIPNPTADPSTVRLTTAADPTTPLAFTATRLPDGDYLIVPTAPLVQGTTYVLEDRATCDLTPSPRVSFTAGPSAPIPASLGSVSVLAHGLRSEIDVATSRGICSTKIDAVWVEVELAPSAEVAPWLPLLLFETVVDGVPWKIQESRAFPLPPGESWSGRGRDTLFRTCVTNPEADFVGMSPGGHQVAFRAAIPNGATISTAPQAVELMCDAVEPNPEEPNPDDRDSDGGCSATRSGSSLLLAAGLLLVVLRRRRR